MKFPSSAGVLLTGNEVLLVEFYSTGPEAKTITDAEYQALRKSPPTGYPRLRWFFNAPELAPTLQNFLNLLKTLKSAEST